MAAVGIVMLMFSIIAAASAGAYIYLGRQGRLPPNIYPWASRTPSAPTPMTTPAQYPSAEPSPPDIPEPPTPPSIDAPPPAAEPLDEEPEPIIEPEQERRVPIDFVDAVKQCPEGLKEFRNRCFALSDELINDGWTMTALGVASKPCRDGWKEDGARHCVREAETIDRKKSPQGPQCPSPEWTLNPGGVLCRKPMIKQRERRDPTCPSGYSFSGGECVKSYARAERSTDCPSGYRNQGATCYRPRVEGETKAKSSVSRTPARTVTSCRDYRRSCPSGYTRTAACSCRRPAGCPSGYREVGSRCYRTNCPSGNWDTNRPTYCRREPIPADYKSSTCPGGWEKRGGKCHKKCPAGWQETRGECRQTASSSCPSGWEQRGNQCFEPCASGFITRPLTCYREEGGETTPSKCPEGYDRSGGDCYAKCPDGWETRPQSCYKPRQREERETKKLEGQAKEAVCPNDGMELNAAKTKCYPPCPNGSEKRGNYCVYTATRG